jgi:hypothetical protein
MESRGVICPVATPEGGPIAIAIPVPAHGQRQANAGGGRQGHRRRMRDAQQLGRDDVREKKRRERSPMSSKNPARREVGASDSREPRTLYAAQAVMWQETGMVGGPPCRCCGVVGTVDDPIVSPCSICELCGADTTTVFASGRYCSKRCAAKQRYARAGDPPIPVVEAGPVGPTLSFNLVSARCRPLGPQQQVVWWLAGGAAVQQTAGLSRDGGRTAAVVWRLLADRVLHAATPDTGEGTRKQWAWSAANTTPGGTLAWRQRCCRTLNGGRPREAQVLDA